MLNEERVRGRVERVRIDLAAVQRDLSGRSKGLP
jgi:hypothetical protein